jgi:hypothetical protein
MPPKVRICKSKPKNVKKTNEQIGNIMKDILQADRNSDDYGNSYIELEKYKKYIGNVREFLKLLFELVTEINDEDLSNRIKYFRKVLIDTFREFYKFDISDYERELDITQMPKTRLKLLRNKYLDLKDSLILTVPIIISKNILSCKLDSRSVTADGNRRYEEFCIAAAKSEIELNLFKYIKLGDKQLEIGFDFCTIFNGSNFSARYTEERKRKIFGIIIGLCEVGKEINSNKMTPDIDIASIFPKIIELLEKFKDKVHGCDRAFDIIKRSSAVFEKNCNKYIGKATRSKNPMLLFTEFVDDIVRTQSNELSEGNSTNVTIVNELKTLIREMRSTIEKSMMMNKKVLPDNIKFVMDVTEVYIDELEMNTSGPLPTTAEVADKQKRFNDFFIP